MPVFDKKRALASVDGDTALLQELLKLFRTEYPELLHRLGDAIGSGNPEALRLYAHSLKGTLVALGAVDAGRTALALEEQGQTRDLNDAPRTYSRLVGELRDFEREVFEYERTLV